MMTPLQVRKLQRYKESFGIMTSQEAIELALGTEVIAKDCGVFDPAFSHFNSEVRNLTDYAELLIKEKS